MVDVVKIAPGSPEWLRFMSPSKAAAVLGLSRYESPRSLWHRMRGELPPEDPKDIFAVGHAYEHTLAYLWKEQNPGWRLSRREVQVVATERFGFPLLATVDRRASRGSRRRVVEMKTARKLEDWGDQFTDEAPADYLVQTIVQRAVTGWTDEPADLFVMGPYFRHHCYSIPWDQDLADAVIDELAAFYKRLSDPDAAPELDDTVPTYQALRALHPEIDGRTVNVPVDLALEYVDALETEKAAAAAARLARSKMLEAMGSAQYARVPDPLEPELDGVLVAKRQAKGKTVSVVTAGADYDELADLKGVA